LPCLRIQTVQEPTKLVIFLLDQVRDAILAEVGRWPKLETGGVLIGYWSEGEVVVTRALGPGPKAIHRSRSFLPDQRFQEDAIAESYRRSNRIETYLGDWHSHMSGTGRPSSMDIATMIRIARSSEARTTRPLMAIATPKATTALRIWILTKLPSLRRSAIVSEASVHVFTNV
jgi:integrative and conjugative element protein (TIGR02256 family)